MKRFLQTLALVAVMALPFASMAQGTLQTVWSQDFDAGTVMPSEMTKKQVLLPAGTTNIPVTFTTSTGSWNIKASSAGQGFSSNHAYNNVYGSSKKDWMISPAINLSGTNCQLAFDLALTAYSGNNPAATTGTDDRFVVLVSTDNMATWTILRQWDNASSEYVYNNIPLAGENVTLDLSAYSGQTLRVAFYVESTVSNADNNLHVDNIVVNEMVSCIRPSAVTPANITSNSVDVTWTAGGSETSWMVRLVNEAGNVVDSAVASTASHTFTGLQSNSLYTVTVAAICSATDISGAASSAAFRTACSEMVLPYSNNFDGELTGSSTGTNAANFVYCWSRLIYNPGTSSYPYISGTSGMSSSKCLYFYQGSTAGTSYSDACCAVLPQVNTTLYPIAGLRLAANYKSSSTNATMYVGVLSDPDDYTTFVPVDTIHPSGNTWTLHTTYFNNYAGSGSYIAICMPMIGSYQTVYVDEVTLDVAPSCLEPNAPTAGSLSATSMVANWTANGSEAQWDFRYKASADTAWTTINGLTSATYSMTGLNALTTYQMQARAICSASDQSGWSPVGSATTLCAVEALPYVADYGNFTSCWNRYTGLVDGVLDGTVNLTASTAGWTTSTNVWGASHYKVNVYGTSCKYWMATPTINVSANAQLLFDAALTAYGNSNAPTTVGDDDRFVVLATTDGGATWTKLMSFGTAEGDDALFSAIPNTGASYAVSLSQFLGENVRIAFYGESTVSGGDNDLHVHNIMVEEVPTCPRPANFAVDSVSATSALLSWNAGASESAWQIQYRLAGDSAWTAVAENIATTTYTLTGLTPSSNYEVQLRAYCAADDQSPWVSASFVTECAPFALPWQDDLANGFSRCWNRYTGLLTSVMDGSAQLSNSTSGWNLNTSTVFTVPQHVKVNIYGSSCNYWLVTPEVHIDGMAELSFDAAYMAYSYGSTIDDPDNDGIDDRFVVLATTNNGASWTILRQYGEDTTRDDASLLSISTNGQNIVIPVEMANADVRFAFYAESTASNADNDLHIGNIHVDAVAAPLASLIFDFEDAADNANWQFLAPDGAANTWAIGSAASNGGANAAYVSNDGGVTNAYTTNSTVNYAYAYREITLGDADYVYSFDWRCSAENNWDFLRVALVPADVALDQSGTRYSTSTPSGWIALDGGSQLAGQSSWQTRNGVVSATAGNYKLVLYWRNDSSGGSNPPAAIDNISIVPLTCPAPANLAVADLTPISANITWSPVGSESEWLVLLTNDGNTVDSAVVTTSSYSFANLSASTSYTASVYALCSADDNSIAVSASFTTLCAVEQLPYVANYNNFSSCWNVYSGQLATILNDTTATLSPSSYGWSSNSRVFGSTHYSMNVYSTNAYWMVTPTINISANAQLLFDAAVTAYYSTDAYSNIQDDDQFVVLVTADGGNTWTPIKSFGSAATDDALLSSISNTGSSYTVSLAQYLGQDIRIAFYGGSTTSGSDFDLHVANIIVEEVPACARPSDLAVSNITADAATLTWNAGASETAWQIQYKVASDSVWTLVTDPVTTTTFSLSGLSASTSYDVQLRAYCNATDQSAWISTSFRTLCGVMPMPWQDDLATGISECWGRYSGNLDGVMAGTAQLSSYDYGWGLNSNVLTGQHVKVNIYGSSCNYWVVTPAIHIDQNAELSFDAAYTAYSWGSDADAPDSNGTDDRFVVLMSTDNTNWTILRQYGEDATRDDASLLSIPLNGTRITIPVSGLTNADVRFAFYGESSVNNADNDLHIGNIRVDSAAVVPPVATFDTLDFYNMTVSTGWDDGYWVEAYEPANTTYSFQFGFSAVPTVGVTYDLTSMEALGVDFEEFSIIMPYEASYLKTISGDTTRVEATLFDSVTLYRLHYMTIAPATIDTITFSLPSVELIDQTSMGAFLISGEDTVAENSFAVAFYSSSIIGNYTDTDVLPGYTELYYNGVEVTVSSLNAAITSIADGFHFDGFMTATTGSVYHITMDYLVPGIGDTTYLVMDEMNVTYYASDNDWYYILSDNEGNEFMFDIVANNIVSGQVYTLTDMLEDYTAGYYNDTYIGFASASFTQTVTNGDTAIHAFVESTLGAYFDITYGTVAAPDSVTITVLSADAAMGTVTGSGRYEVGENVTISAVANDGFHFVAWNDGETLATRTIVATVDATFTATFASNSTTPDSATITVVAADATMGTVTGSGVYEVGQTITISAVANAGYHFVAWNDGNTEATRQIVVTADATYTATFEADENGIDDVMGNITIATRGRNIVIMGAENESLVIFDVQGRIVVRENNMAATTYPMTATGVYMVKVGSRPAQKVVVVR